MKPRIRTTDKVTRLLLGSNVKWQCCYKDIISYGETIKQSYLNCMSKNMRKRVQEKSFSNIKIAFL